MHGWRKLVVGVAAILFVGFCLIPLIINLRQGDEERSSPRPTSTPRASGGMGTDVDGETWRIVVNHAYGVQRPAPSASAASRGTDSPEATSFLIYLDVGLANRTDTGATVKWDQFVLRDADGGTYLPESRYLGKFPFAGVIYQGTPREGRLTYVVLVDPGALDQLTLILREPRGLDRTEVALDDFYLAEKVSLTEAVTGGMIEVAVTGQSLETIGLEIRPQLELSLEVDIEVGTLFKPQVEGLQDMVVRTGQTVVVEPNLSLELELEVACADMHLTGPAGGEGYTIGEEPPPDDLLRLLQAPEFQKAEFRLQQFSIWTITDNPGRADYVGLGGTGIGTPPSELEFDQIRNLFESAGIDLTGYSALG